MTLKDKYSTISGAAKEIGVTRQTISRWVADGKISAEKVGRETLIKKKDLHEYQRRRLSYEAATQIAAMFFNELNDYCREKGYINTNERVKETTPHVGYGVISVEKRGGTSRTFKMYPEQYDEVLSRFEPKLKTFLSDFAHITRETFQKVIKKVYSPKKKKGGR